MRLGKKCVLILVLFLCALLLTACADQSTPGADAGSGASAAPSPAEDTPPLRRPVRRGAERLNRLRRRISRSRPRG